MDEKILKWIYDVRIAINEIDSFFQLYAKDFFEYKNNLILKRATERELEIIGEAINRILKQDSTFEVKISNAKSIIGLRNQVIHAYDNISDENIWSILINHLPKLKLEIEKIINDSNSSI
jgi:uncharacterized protein with HEPN domain